MHNGLWIDFVEEDYETSILQRSDRRRDDEKREFIVKTVDNYHCKKISTQQLVKVLKTTLGIQERQIKSLLTELVKDGRIKNEERGYYTSIECVTQKDGNNGN
jgi:DNA-binding transcriptional regulator PaaX